MEHAVHVCDSGQIRRVSRIVHHVAGPVKRFVHGGPSRVAPLVDRLELERVYIIAVQADILKAIPQHGDGIVSGNAVRVRLGAADICAVGAITPQNRVRAYHWKCYAIVRDAGSPRGDKRHGGGITYGDDERPGVAFLFGVRLAQYGRSSYVQRIHACRWQVCRVERECLVVHDKPGVIYRVCGHKTVQVTVLRPDGKHRVGSQDGRVLHHVPVGQILIKGGGA